MIKIRPFEPADWPAVWAILQPVFAAGETYSFPREISESAARAAWLDVPAKTFVALVDGEVLGTYYIKPNQPGLGSHVCNCGYVVAERARGRGLASRMCEQSQDVAREMGFRAMQYNLVVSTNEGAVRLWQQLGFEVVGRLPGAFLHPSQGYVDALVMYKTLVG